MARTAKTNLKILNNGTVLPPGGFDTLDLMGSLIGANEGNGVVSITGSGGGSGSKVATEVLSPTQSGSDITLDLTALSHAFVAVEVVFRNGQAITPISSWSLSGNTVTVFNADATETFMVQYTY